LPNPTEPPTSTTHSSLVNSHKSTTLAYYIAYIALGMSVAALGPTLFGLAENTETTLSQISILFTAMSLGGMIGSLIGGYLYDNIIGNPVMGLALIGMTLGLALTPIIPTLWLLSLVIFLLGIVVGITDVGGNILLVWLHRDRVEPYMNTLHFFFGVGAFISPLVIAQALNYTDDVRWAYWILATLALIASFQLFRTPSPVAPVASEQAPLRPAKPLIITLLVLFFFLFVAGEISYAGWIAPYVVASDLATEANAAYLTSLFWGALTIGRLISIPLAFRFSLKVILWSDLLLCMLGLLIILVWPQTLTMVGVGTILVGLGMASLFPAGISLAERSMTVTGRITSFLLVGGSLGSMSIPWIIGQLFEPIGPQSVLWIITGVMGGALVLLVILQRQTKLG